MGTPVAARGALLALAHTARCRMCSIPVSMPTSMMPLSAFASPWGPPPRTPAETPGAGLRGGGGGDPALDIALQG